MNSRLIKTAKAKSLHTKRTFRRISNRAEEGLRSNPAMTDDQDRQQALEFASMVSDFYEVDYKRMLNFD